jgi:uncharacterized protein (DUF849 family)
MARKTIITCALTGGAAWPRHHPNFPVTAAQIAQQGIDAAAAGANVLHIHVRDAETGAMCNDVALYGEVMDRIRQKNDDVVINLTTGWGCTFIPTEGNRALAGPGSCVLEAPERVHHVVTLKPDICTLDLNTMQLGDLYAGDKSKSIVAMNLLPVLVEMATAIRDAGVTPEIEIFDAGDLMLAQHLISEGVLDGPGLYTLVLGLRYGLAANPETMLYARGCLPQGAIWTGIGTGAQSFPMAAQSFLYGGHVRVGLEDNLYIAKGQFAPSNAALVEKVKVMLDVLGAQFATNGETREILGLTNALPARKRA